MQLTANHTPRHPHRSELKVISPIPRPESVLFDLHPILSLDSCNFKEIPWRDFGSQVIRKNLGAAAVAPPVVFRFSRGKTGPCVGRINSWATRTERHQQRMRENAAPESTVYSDDVRRPQPRNGGQVGLPPFDSVNLSIGKPEYGGDAGPYVSRLPRSGHRVPSRCIHRDMAARRRIHQADLAVPSWRDLVA